MTPAYIRDILEACTLIPWQKLDGSRVLVTGASGLIGSCVTEMLLCGSKSCEVWASGRNKSRLMRRFNAYLGEPRFHILIQDLNEAWNCETGFDYIIHAAGYANPRLYATMPVEVISTNVNALTSLLEHGREHGTKRLLYVSSEEVYGECDSEIIEESCSGYVDNTSPRSCYPASKRLCETLCAAFSSEYGLETVIARPSHVYGPFFTESDNRVYAQFLRNVLAGEDIVMKSAGDQLRSWCYVVDCASALLTILLSGDCSQAYNIADNSSEITIRQLAETIADSCGLKVVTVAAESDEKKGYNPVTRSVLSTAKLERLGWKVIPGDVKRKLITTMLTQKDYSCL